MSTVCRACGAEPGDVCGYPDLDPRPDGCNGTTAGGRSGDDDGGPVVPFAGRSHAEVLDLTFGDEPADLIENLAPAGVVMTTAGLPETYKGWVSTKMSYVIAAGEGEVFGCPAVAQGPVGYFWQDDSTRNEAERVKLFSAVHNTPADLPIRWHLNEDLQLPRDLDRLRATIEHHGYIFVSLDSWYNVATGIDLTSTEAGEVFAQLKSQVCDPTGCTVNVVDHMAWATEQNRKRQRGYGSVFKNAAIRAGIYIDAEGSKLWVEARGNNIKGFNRTPAYWDADTLELRLIDTAQVDENERYERLVQWVTDTPGQSTTKVLKGVGGNNDTARKLLHQAETAGRVTSYRPSGRDDTQAPTYWYPPNHAGLPSVQPPRTLLDTTPSTASQDTPSVQASVPRRGTLGGTAATNQPQDTGQEGGSTAPSGDAASVGQDDARASAAVCRGCEADFDSAEDGSRYGFCADCMALAYEKAADTTVEPERVAVADEHGGQEQLS